MCGTGVCARWRCIVTVLRLLYDDDLRLLLLLLRRVLGRSRRGNAELRAQAFSRVSAASDDEEHNQGDAEDDATDGDAGFGAVDKEDEEDEEDEEELPLPHSMSITL